MYCFHKSRDRRTHIFQQILVYEDSLETELLWVTSDQFSVPYGAVLAGHKDDDGPLSVARIDSGSRSYAGNYDPDKRCAEYLVYNTLYGAQIKCGFRWEIPVIIYGACLQIIP